MTDNNSVDEDQKDPRSVEDHKDPDEQLRGLNSERCRYDEEGNVGSSSEQESLGCGEAPSSELDQAELQLAKEKLTSNDISFVIETFKKKAPYDEIPIKQLFYGMSSAFTKIPIPHNVNSKDTGAGKSYLLGHVAEYFPNKYVLPLTGMSDKAIFHRPGVMVIEKNNDKTQELDIEPIDPILNELELKIEEIQEQMKTGKNTSENKRRIKEIESEIKDINERAEKLIDLNNQIILGLDTPSRFTN
jgi:hypothetical protein